MIINTALLVTKTIKSLKETNGSPAIFPLDLTGESITKE